MHGENLKLTFSFLQNVTTTQLVRIFPGFNVSQSSLQFSQHPITEPYIETNSLSLRSTLKSSHLCQRLLSYLFPSYFLPKSFIQSSATKCFLPISYFLISFILKDIFSAIQMKSGLPHIVNLFMFLFLLGKPK